MRDCEQCGYPLTPSSSTICPKCRAAPGEYGRDPILEIDVAHQGESWETSRAKILQAIDQSMFQNLQGVKIIHGYGSSTGHSVIAPRAIALMRHLAEEYGGRYTQDKQTRGASLIWWNKRKKTSKDPRLEVDKTPISEQSPSHPQNHSFGGNWFDQAIQKNKRNSDFHS